MTEGSGQPFIEFQDVTLGYGSQIVLRNVNLTVGQGDFLGIVGPNGSGKTTLLKAVLGLAKPLSGTVRIRSPVRFGYVPQREILDEIYPLTVLDVVMMSRVPVRGLGKSLTDADRQSALWALDQVGLADLSDKLYRHLSGGQKQRTLLARALAAEPNVLILDEPTNGLDLASEGEIMALLRDLHSRQGATIIFVTHLLNLVLNSATRLALLHDGTVTVGTVHQIASPDSLKKAYGLEATVRELNGYRFVVAKSDRKF